jgi:hypothetical protein
MTVLQILDSCHAMLFLCATEQGAQLRYYAGRLSVVIKWSIDVCPTTFEEVQQSTKKQWRRKIPRMTLLSVTQSTNDKALT